MPANAQQGGICSRTEVVRENILQQIMGTNQLSTLPNCATITTVDLAGITSIIIPGTGSELTALQSGDFAGLTELEELFILGFPELTTVPADIFNGLPKLEAIQLTNNPKLTTLPAGIFNGLSALTSVSLDNNGLTTLPAGIFSQLTSLTSLNLSRNPLPASLPAGLFPKKMDVPRAAISLPSQTTINEIPTTVGTIAPITALVAMSSPQTVNVANNFSDPGDMLTFTAASDDMDIATVTVSGSEVTVTPLARGTATITVTATDAAGQTVTQDFAVTVVNPAPTAVDAIDDITGLVANGSTGTVDVVNNFSDPYDMLMFAAVSNNTAAATVEVSGSVVTIEPVAAGMATITVTATDLANQSIEQTFMVTVAANEAPTIASAIANITDLVANGSTRTVDVVDNFSDTNDMLTFTAMSSTDAIATVGVSGSEVTITPVAAGMATITVTATDLADQTVTQTFEVTVAPNPAPTKEGTIADITDLVANGETRTVDVEGNFSDTDALTFTAVSDDMDIATVTVSGSEVTVTPLTAGMATITVTATDLASQTATQTFEVTVIAATVITGTNEVDKISVSVSPNPIKDRVKITVADDGVYQLLDTSGKVLISGKLTTGDNNVALPSLIEGIYLLKIQTKLGSTTRKVIKE